MMEQLNKWSCHDKDLQDTAIDVYPGSAFMRYAFI